MSNHRSDEKVFRDIVHNFIYVTDKPILDLINTKEMQRLRRIKQLGTSYLTYHSAEHTRFTHSLGTYEIMRKVLSIFQRNGLLNIDEDERLLYLCSALLHDIGHGPFSHAIEKVIDRNHEEWTKEIIEGDTEINKVLRGVDANFPKYISDIISKVSSKKLIINLISSQLDVDRMDYLLRDSIVAGVSYGHFDLERLLRVLIPYNDIVVVKESGLHCVEQYLLARYYMYWQVYFHPTTRSAEIILKKIFERAIFLYKNDEIKDYFLPKPIKSLLKNDLSLEEFLKLDEIMVLYCFKEWTNSKDEILSDLCNRFINRRLFEYIDCKESVLKEPMLFFEIQECLKELYDKKGIKLEYYFDIDRPRDVSYDYYRPGEKEEKVAINIYSGTKIVELSRKSKPVSALAGEELIQHRIYYVSDMIGKDDSKLKEILNKISGVK
ncbi:HD domain-containing protein [Caldicellulosiruptoraceae bacterium PP1]